MTEAGRWARVKGLVGEALELEPGQRTDWLARQDVPDDIRAEAQALVDAEARAGDFLEAAALSRRGAAAALFEATAVHAAPRVASGQVLGAYRILGQLGEGGMATVYLGERADDAFRKQVAIKLVRSGGDAASLADRLQQERRLLATLDHPNIARLIDGGATDEGVPYVVMEYVEGVPIDEFCRSRAASPAACVTLVRTICDAVHHAHRNLVVHRDIKVSNILVTPDGTPKLVDFGIAKALDADRQAQTLTGFGAMTPESASPEQVSGGPVTVATDIYGLGALLYRLLTGRGPFAHATNAADLLRAVCRDDPEPPSLVAPGPAIARDLDLIVLKALRKRPDDRYDSVAALAADLDRFLDGRPVAAAPDSTAYRVRRFVARHRLATAVAVAAAATLTAGVTTIVWQGRVAQRERARAERRFDDLRRLANTLVFDIHDAVLPLPGSTPVLKTLVESALTYLDSLAAEARNEIALQRDLANAYERLSSVQGRIGNANLGDHHGALASVAKAVTLREAVVGVPGAGPDDVVALAASYGRRAQLATTPDARQASVEEGFRVLRMLSHTDAEQPPAVVVTATLLWIDAGAHTDRKDYRTAAERYRRAAVLYEQLLRMSGSDRFQDASRNLAIAHKTLGAVLWMLDDRTGASDAYRKALALDEARLATQPDNTTWLLDVSFSLASLAHAELATDDTAASLSHYEQSLALRKRALAGDPQNAQARAAVERAYRTLARVLSIRGDVERALAASAQAVSMARDHSALLPDDQRAGPLIDALLNDADVRRELASRHPARAALHQRAACRGLDEVAQLQDAAQAHGIATPPGIDAESLARARLACMPTR